MASGAALSCDVRQNYHSDCEKAVNSQIQLELEALYSYLSMASYFERSDIALPGFSRYFSKAAMEELGHVEALTNYQNKRGGKVIFQDIMKPAKDEWGSGEGGQWVSLSGENSGLASHSLQWRFRRLPVSC